MNSKIAIAGVMIAIIIGVFVFIVTNNTNSDLEEIPSEIVESVTEIENIEPQQPEGKQFTVELSDGLNIKGP